MVNHDVVPWFTMVLKVPSKKISAKLGQPWSCHGCGYVTMLCSWSSDFLFLHGELSNGLCHIDKEVNWIKDAPLNNFAWNVNFMNLKSKIIQNALKILPLIAVLTQVILVSAVYFGFGQPYENVPFTKVLQILFICPDVPMSLWNRSLDV